MGSDGFRWVLMFRLTSMLGLTGDCWNRTEKAKLTCRSFHLLSVSRRFCTDQQSLVGVVWRGRFCREGPPDVDHSSRQGHVGQPSPSHPAAVVGDFKGAAFVIIQTAA